MPLHPDQPARSAPPQPADDPTAPLSLIQALYDAFARGDRAAILASLSPEVEWEMDTGNDAFPLRERHVGRAGVARLLSGPQGLPFQRIGLLHCAQSGDEIAVLLDTTPQATAAQGTAPWIEAHLWSFDSDGLVIRFRQVSGTARPPGPTRH